MMSAPVKRLKSGKISIKVDKIYEILSEGILSRLVDEEDEVRKALLTDVREKLLCGQARVKLSQAEFLCLFEEETMINLPEILQGLVFSTVYFKKNEI